MAGDSRQTAGSSPRMRGTQSHCRPCMMRTGIIPAYAGNTRSAYCNAFSFRDHPRVCGEHQHVRYILAVRLGSSPRMRGTLQTLSSCARLTGIIPAYAGNTGWEFGHVEDIGDHPRVCGEHIRAPSDGGSGGGSSPRMRGTRKIRRFRHLERRIIPAYAGNTKTPRHHMRGYRDHPRVCGEHLELLVKSCDKLGSSPRMRGTPGRMVRSGKDHGIIPAYAGNTP